MDIGETPAFNACRALDPTQVSDAGRGNEAECNFLSSIEMEWKRSVVRAFGAVVCGSCACRPLPGSSEFSVYKREYTQAYKHVRVM
jgi:hypothetical protein